MFTLTLRASIALHGATTPDFTRIFTKQVPAGFTITPQSLYTIAGAIADHYLDAGPVCVGDLEALALIPTSVTRAPQAIALDATA